MHAQARPHAPAHPSVHASLWGAGSTTTQDEEPVGGLLLRFLIDVIFSFQGCHNHLWKAAGDRGRSPKSQPHPKEERSLKGEILLAKGFPGLGRRWVRAEPNLGSCRHPPLALPEQLRVGRCTESPLHGAELDGDDGGGWLALAGCLLTACQRPFPRTLSLHAHNPAR